MNFTDVTDISTTRTISDCTLPDFVSSGIAYRILVPGGGADDYYLLENHQRISAFDVPDNNVSTAKGVYVLHQQGDEGDGVGIVSAQGRFNWTVPYQLPNIYGSSPANLPVFQRLASNRVSGFSKRQNIPWTWQGNYQGAAPIHYHLDFFTGALRQAPPTIFTGDGTDQFDLGTAPVFTPWSNPSSDLYNNVNKIGFEIKGVQSGLYTFDIYVNNSLNAAPSSPQNVRITNTSGGNVNIAWDPNAEPDISGYQVWRNDLTFQTGWLAIATTSSTSYTDPDYGWAGTWGNNSLQYKVRAKDNSNQYSSYSSVVSCTGEPNEKINAGPQAKMISVSPHEFALRQNYPNPFNPATTISFSIPQSGFVWLQVFDILGKEVAVLVKDTREAGTYSVSWDASRMPSGLYIARLDAAGRSILQKMLLIK